MFIDSSPILFDQKGCLLAQIICRDRMGAGFTTTYAISTYHH
jgi:hypothetical protein